MNIVSTGVDYWLNISKHITVTVDEIEDRLTELQTWCFSNLNEGSWYFEEFVSITDCNDKTMVFAKYVSFINKEDATAFKIRFKL